MTIILSFYVIINIFIWKVDYSKFWIRNFIFLIFLFIVWQIRIKKKEFKLNYRNKLNLLKLSSKILKGFFILLSAFLLMSIFTASYYLVAEPLNTPCLMCVGCPCPYRDFIRARNYYFNFLLPKLIIYNLFFMAIITIFMILIAILKNKYDSFGLNHNYNP